MSWTLPSVLALYDLAVARAATLAPRVLSFGETPPDATSRNTPYLIVDPAPGFDAVTRGDGRTSSRRGSFDVRCCGSSRRQATLALDACRDVMQDWRPYPADRRFGAIRETDAGPLIEDRSVPTDPRFSFTLTFELDDD